MATATEPGAGLALHDDRGAIQLLLDLERAGAIDKVSLTLTDPALPYETWEAMGRFLGQVDRSSRWYIGDWIVFGEAVYGEEHAQAVDTKETRYDVAERVTGLDNGTLMNVASICGRVARERRREELGFWIHGEVAQLDPGEQVEWLEKAVVNGWTRSELRAAIKEAKAPAALPGLDPPAGEPGLSPAERLEQAARLVYHQGSRTSDGSVVVPATAWAQLAAALGEE